MYKPASRKSSVCVVSLASSSTTTTQCAASRTSSSGKNASNISSIFDEDQSESSLQDLLQLQEDATQNMNRMQQQRRKQDGDVLDHSTTMVDTDEQDRKDMMWLVRNTNDLLLGPDPPAIGTLSRSQIQRSLGLLKAWAYRAIKRPSSKGAPHVVDRLLTRLLQERDFLAETYDPKKADERVPIGTSLYNLVLKAWSVSRSSSSDEDNEDDIESSLLPPAERCDDILTHMEELATVLPDEMSYTTVIKAYVKNGNRTWAATQKAEEIWDRMLHHDGVLPIRGAYNLVLYAIANAPQQPSSKRNNTTTSHVVGAGMRAQTMLAGILDRYQQQQEKEVSAEDFDRHHYDCELCKPDANTFTQVLSAWARGQRRKRRYDKENTAIAQKMESVFQQLLDLPEEMDVRPSTDTFNALMGGWHKSMYSASSLSLLDVSPLDRIVELVQMMEERYRDGDDTCRPDQVTVNTLSAAYTKFGGRRWINFSLNKRAEMVEAYDLQENTVGYNHLVDSWCKGGRRDAPEQVLDILETMEMDFVNGCRASMPDGYTYSSVIGSFTKGQRSYAGEIADELLERMTTLHHDHGGASPTISVYNAVLNAWASSLQTDQAAKRIKELVARMEENEDQDPSIPRPDRVSYNTLLKAMRDGSASAAADSEALLLKLESKGATQKSLLPDSYTYTSVISVFARSNEKDKADKSWETIQRMMLSFQQGNLVAKPTVYPFNAALNACAFSKGNTQEEKLSDFDTAQKIYDELRRHASADTATYGAMLRICAVLLPKTDPRREAMVSSLFQKACKSGSVGRMVLTQLRFAATPKQHVELTGRSISDRISYQDLPDDWTHRVKDGHRKPRLS